MLCNGLAIQCQSIKVTSAPSVVFCLLWAGHTEAIFDYLSIGRIGETLKVNTLIARHDKCRLKRSAESRNRKCYFLLTWC
jgi:hypothetical protein